MAAAFDFVEGSVHEFDLPDLDKAFQRMEAASVMIRQLQDLRSPHRGATPPTDATAIAKHLVAAASAQTRLRHDACMAVLDNLRYCKQNGLTLSLDERVNGLPRGHGAEALRAGRYAEWRR